MTSNVDDPKSGCAPDGHADAERLAGQAHENDGAHQEVALPGSSLKENKKKKKCTEKKEQIEKEEKIKKQIRGNNRICTEWPCRRGMSGGRGTRR